MKKLLIFFLIVAVSTFSIAQRKSSSSHRSSSSHSHSSSVSVKSYTKKDGTHVTAHTRAYSSPSSSRTSSRFGVKSYHSPKSSSVLRTSSGHQSTQKAVGVQRDNHGKIKRSSSAKERFMRQTGFPKGRPGYVIDHIIPLSRGGRDDTSNMQWQTKAEAKAKDRWERGAPNSRKK
jgi:hypothetical protein